jgi:phospholipase/carboxylesterase
MTLHLGAKLTEAKVACVFVHGRGQSPEAMQDHVISRLTARDVAFILPRAKSGSWYTARGIDPLTDTTRHEIESSLSQLELIIKTIPNNIPLLLAGFSQGACLLTEYALKNGPWHGALACFTGCRVGVASDVRPIADLNNLPIYLTGADADPWIPVDYFSQAAGYFSKARARLRVDSFPGRSHEVNNTEVLMLDHMLVALANSKPLWQGA